MGYSDYLKQTLKPLQLYKLHDSIVSSEIGVCGNAMDEVFDGLCDCEREMLPLTASEYGLEMFERLLPYAPRSQSTEERRAAIAALMMIDRNSVTPEKLNRTLRGCGINAAVTETGFPQVVTVGFPDGDPAPENIGKLKKMIEKILPCHLVALYETDFITWQELEGLDFVFSQFETEGLLWISFLIYE